MGGKMINELWGKEYNDTQPIKTINKTTIRIEEWNICKDLFMRKSTQGKITDYGWFRKSTGCPMNIKILENKRLEYIMWHKRKQLELTNGDDSK